MISAEIFKKNCLFRLKLSAWGNSRKGELSDDAVLKIIGNPPADMPPAEQAERIRKAKAQLRLSKKLVDSEEYKEVSSFMTATSNQVQRTFCNKSFIDDGLYLVSFNSVERVTAFIEQAKARLAESLLPAFIERYAMQVTEAKSSLGEQFKESDYPPAEEVAKAFRMEYRFVRMEVPEGLPPEVRAAEEAKLREQFQQAQQKIVASLWEEFGKVVTYVQEKLKPGEDGKRKKLYDSLFDNLTGFIGTFADRNAMDDTRLAELVKRAEEILKASQNGKPLVDTMRGEDYAREKAARAFGVLKEEIAAGIQTLGTRGFDFSEET